LFRITEIVNDQAVRELDLCEDCVQAYLIAQPSKAPVALSQEAKGVLDAFNIFAEAIDKLSKSSQITSKSSIPPCSKCGMTIEEIRKTGQFGCPVCYEHFATPQIIESLHGSSQHVGKVPKRWKREQEELKFEKRKGIPVNLRIKGLEAKKAQAVKSEKYELASSIKKALYELQERQQEIQSLTCDLQIAKDENNQDQVKRIKARLVEIEDECLEIERAVLL
jgi:protein arginine kinase activator